jgi:MFS family permease
MAYYSSAAERTSDGAAPAVSRGYAWLVFAVCFGMLISDYMSRQVLNAVFPLLKAEWALSDSRLGMLSGIVALMVGVLTFPLSLLADRWGRVKSLALMAALWSLATLGCSLAQNFGQMFFARFLVGVGEAAYGSVGIAVVLSVFPRHLRASLTGAFMAGGMLGSVLGMAIGGAIAAKIGWRWAFGGMAAFGLVLAAICPLVVRETRAAGKRDASQTPLSSLFASRSLCATYVASGLHLFAGGACMAWMPSFFSRYYAMDTGRAGAFAAVVVLASGAGMILCGMFSDRLSRVRPSSKAALAAWYSLASAVLLTAGLLLPAGAAQLALVCCGMFFAAAATGPSGAIVAELSPGAIHGTAFATLTLANNLLGLAPGPFLTGVLADRFGLNHAFQVLPLVSLAAAGVFLYVLRHYKADAARMEGTEA